MSQIFHRSTNTIARVSIFAVVILASLAGFLAYRINTSPYYTSQDVAEQQPVPFSHKHHVTDDGIDCRYCHTSVENSSFAGIPPTHTCMTCHSQLWVHSPMLEPVRESYRTGRSIEWKRVNALPEFVYFNHSIHIHKGVGCTTCHGQVGRMPLTWRAHTLYMRWCIQCHNHPEEKVRPRGDVFSATYQPPSSLNPVTYRGVAYTSQLALGRVLVKDYHIKKPHELTDCYTCHR